MRMNIEKEYKILVNQNQFTELLKEFPQATFRKQVNTYYDTQHLDIRKVRGAMRIREVGNRFLFTLKLHGDQGVEEYETYVKENSVTALNTPEICDLLHKISVTDPIMEITRLTTYRAIIDTGDAELCFDYNEYGGHEDFEIEYEYKRPHEGKAIFNQILQKVGLTYHKNCPSKLKRALDTL